MSFKLRDEHWEMMLSFLEKNKDLATGRCVGVNGREKSKKLWAELSIMLNSLGFGERTPEKCKKWVFIEFDSWTDLKYLIKKKGAIINKNQGATGGGLTLDATSFNKNELRVLELLGDTFYIGVGEPEIAQMVAEPSRLNVKVPFRATPTCGKLNLIDDITPKNQETESCPILDHGYSYSPAPKKRRRDLIENSYQETINILNEIKVVVDRRLGEISEGLKDIKDAIKANQSGN